MAYVDDLEYENKCFYRDNKKLITYLNNKIIELESQDLYIKDYDMDFIRIRKFGKQEELKSYKKILKFIRNGYIELEDE